jgi:transcription-repair coupling factor (superfamily II helicase)
MTVETVFKIDKEIEALLAGETCMLRMYDTSFRSVLLYEYVKVSNRPMFIITPSGEYSDRFSEELGWLSKEQLMSRIFPSWGIIPYNGIFPVIDIQADRITAISEHLSNKTNDIMIASAKALMPLLPVPSLLESLKLTIGVGDKLDITDLSNKLVRLGYTRQGIATSIGEFSIRGGIIDIYPPNKEYPVRIEMLSDTVESIRYYMTIDQRSFKGIDSVFIPPVTEFLAQEGELKVTSPEEMQFERKGTIFDYLSMNTDIVIINPPEVNTSIDRYLDDIYKHHRQAVIEGRAVNDVKSLFMSAEDIKQKLSAYRTITIDSTNHDRVNSINGERAVPVEHIDSFMIGSSGNLQSAFEYLRHTLKQHTMTVVVMKNKDRIEHILKLLSDSEIEVNITDAGYPDFMLRLKNGLNLVQGTMEKGFIYDGIPFITESDLFSVKKGKRKKQAYQGEPINLEELKFGTYVVHREYGIGRLIGTKVMDVDSLKNEFIEVEYRDNAKLYMPVERANMLSQYIPSSDAVPLLDKLGGSSFNSRIKRVREKLYEIANEFINNQAIRELRGGFVFSPPDTLFQSFEEDFQYEETSDQRKAIEDVINDMMSSRPMDRLICGDSGYGKTEVAMRAAFKAVMDNKQVAVLAPTTILSEQHYRTFSERFKKYPVKVEVLNRFRTKAERNKIIKEVANSKIDILIGTHSILKEGIRFKSLGLIIIDEEHKFGVDHKETLKKFNPSADILVITATPIPRTLKMALTGIKDISIITTPPQDRKTTQCYIMKYNESSIRDLVSKELQRNGQVFVVSRKIKGLEEFADRITRIVPSSAVAVAHGQMPSKHLENMMSKFIRKEINVLVSTAIVESGLDIPSANTIIINDADAFGTSELYQLKGRVGRSDQVGYVYFLLPFNRPASPQSLARLKMIASSSELSSGFKLAIHDMEMRGAGNIVGKAQSGHIDAIGLELYSELVKEAMLSIKGETYEEAVEPHLNFPVPAYIPDSYIDDPELRLLFYRKLANADQKNLPDIVSELLDRFGRIPLELEILIKIIKIKVLMKQVRAAKLDKIGNNFRITFLHSTPVKPEDILRLLNEKIMKLKDQKGMQITFEPIYMKGIDGVLKTLEMLSLVK